MTLLRVVVLAVSVAASGASCTTGPQEAEDAAESLEESVGRAARQVVNGAPDTVHQAVVALAMGGSVFCTGTVVGPRAILTAGHCLKRGNRDPKQVTVFFGEDFSAGGETRAVVEGFVHPEYVMEEERGAPLFDVAVLTLAEDAPVLPLPWQQAPLPAMEGATVTLVGYGMTAPGSTGSVGVRRMVDQTVIAVDSFFYYYSREQSGTCQGDSGGPMLLVVMGVPVVIGVTSFGDETCVGFGANTRTDRFADFIAAHVEGGLAAPKQPVTVEFVAPMAGDIVRDTFAVVVRASSRASIIEVVLEVDGAVRATRNEEAWEFGLYGMNEGEHDIVARARAADEGTASARLRVTVDPLKQRRPAPYELTSGCVVGSCVREANAGFASLVGLSALVLRGGRRKRQLRPQAEPRA